MRKKAFILGILVMAVGLGFILSLGYKAAAVDAPHTFENTLVPSSGCQQTCHALHGASGQSLNQVLGNVNLCVNCHTIGNTYDLPVNNPTVPGTVGIHHQYNVPFTNMGASDPRPYFKYATIENPDKIVCSSCHQVHAVDYDRQTTGPKTGINHGYQTTSVQVGSTLTRVAGGGTGTVTFSSVSAAAVAKAYKIKILVGGAVPTATFILSNDGGISWWYWTGATWTTTPGAGKPTGANVDLNDGTNVQVTFAGNFSAGPPADEFITFYVSYPFLRGALDAGDNATGDKFCRNCHANRVNTAAYVESGGDGIKKFNHPVGEALSKSYDRTGAILDANGAVQGSVGKDAITSNDLRLDAGGKIQCYSCHRIHYGDSNSLTEDK